jgi:hypothetical protein
LFRKYAAIAIGQCVVGSSVNSMAPGKLFLQGVASLATASTPIEAATKESTATAVLIISSVASEDVNASLTFGGFLIILTQNVLLSGSQFFFPKNLYKIYIIKNILIRVITEIRIERKKKKLNLPRARLKFNIFIKKQNKDEGFVFKYFRFKKQKFKILSRDISLPVMYQKKLIIK